MDWAMITWVTVLGVIGLLWVMAIAVMQDQNGEDNDKPGDRMTTLVEYLCNADVATKGKS